MLFSATGGAHLPEDDQQWRRSRSTAAPKAFDGSAR